MNKILKAFVSVVVPMALISGGAALAAPAAKAPAKGPAAKQNGKKKHAFGLVNFLVKLGALTKADHDALVKAKHAVKEAFQAAKKSGKGDPKVAARGPRKEFVKAQKAAYIKAKAALQAKLKGHKGAVKAASKADAENHAKLTKALKGVEKFLNWLEARHMRIKANMAKNAPAAKN